MGPGQMCIRGSNMANNSGNSCDDVSKKSDSGGGIHGVSQHWRNLAITFIGIGMAIQGIAKSPRSSFVSVYIDDNVPKTRTTLYLGVISGMSIFGPALAYMMGGLFSSVYITLEDTDMTNKDPRWLGAWWLGFLVFGSVSLVVGIPLLFFPRKIMIKPEIELARMKRKMKRHGKNKVLVELKEFYKAVTRLLMNPLYVMLVVAGGLNAMSLSGSISFAPKYWEAHFNVPTWMVNTMLGLMKVGGASLGTVVGGCVTSKYRLMPMTCLKFKISIIIIVCVLQTAGFFIKCDQPVIHSGSNRLIGNVSQCTSSCGCNDISFYPVCGDDNKNYFSPCHAGCTDVIDGGKTFSNCSCLSNPDISTAKGGLCDGECSSMFWLYCILAFCSILGLGFTMMPAFITVVRSVSEDQKPMALGIASFVHALIAVAQLTLTVSVAPLKTEKQKETKVHSSLIASQGKSWFPGPIVFGMIVDSTCLVTQSSPCGQEFNKNGACLLYDLADLRIRYHSAIITLRFICICLYLAAFLYVKSSSTPKFFAHDDEKGDNKYEDDIEYDDDGGSGGGEDGDEKKLLDQCR